YAASDQQANAAFAREQRAADFLEDLGFCPRQFQVDAVCGQFQPGEMPGKQKWLAAVSAQRFVDAVAEKDAVVEDRNLRVFGRCNYTIDVDAGRHNSRARSHSSF